MMSCALHWRGMIFVALSGIEGRPELDEGLEREYVVMVTPVHASVLGACRSARGATGVSACLRRIGRRGDVDNRALPRAIQPV